MPAVEAALTRPSEQAPSQPEPGQPAEPPGPSVAPAPHQVSRGEAQPAPGATSDDGAAAPAHVPHHAAGMLAAVMTRVGRQQGAGPAVSDTRFTELRKAADARAAKAITPQTRANQEALLADLAQWLARLPPEAGSPTLMTCEPAHIAAFLEDTKDPGGKAPSTVANYRKALSGGFTRIGREQPFSASAPAGNPCASQYMRDYTKGQAREAVARGHVVRAARPMTAARLCLLAISLAERAADPTIAPLARVWLLRDLACALYMWLTATRGGDTVRLQLCEFVRGPGGSELLTASDWAAIERAGADPSARAPQLYIWPLQSKTCKQQRPPVQAVPPQPDPRFCFIRILGKLLTAARAAGDPVRQYLARPRGGGNGEHMTAQNLAGRLRRHMETAGIYEGETCHSYRRGALQDAVHVQGWTELQAQLLGNIATPSILELYLDRKRHKSWRGARPAYPGRGPMALAHREVVTACCAADPDFSDSDDE